MKNLPTLDEYNESLLTNEKENKNNSTCMVL